MDTNELLKDIKKPLFEKYPNLPLNWVCDEDELVHKIVNEWQAEKCVYLLRCTSEALEILQGKNPIFNDNPDVTLDFKKNVDETIVWDWRHLLDIAENKNWKQLQNDSKHYSSSMFVLGYVLIYLLTTAKIYIYLKDHRHNIDLLYIKFADILEQDKDPFIANFPKKSLDRIVQFIKNIRMKDDKYVDDTESYLWEAIENAFPADLQESIDKCIKGEINIDFIPNRIANKLKTEFTSNYAKDTLTLSYDENIKKDLEETFKELLKDDKEISPDIESHLKNLKSEIKKLLSPDNELLTPRQKEVVELVLIKEYKIVDAAKMIIGINNKPIDESVVRQHLKYALIKLRDILKEYNKQ